MEYDKERYKIYTWKNLTMLHWILNPVLAVNELILGQRVPKVTMIDKTINKPRFENTLVPCPHCKTTHDARTWSSENGTAFKNWFGLYCKNCGNIIPCLTNVFSFLILAITYPFWFWLKKSLKSKWLKKQAKRYENIEIENISNPFGKKKWIRTGLIWGAFMFLITLGFEYFRGQEITQRYLLVGLITWTIGGLGFGYTMKLFDNKKVKKIQEN